VNFNEFLAYDPMSGDITWIKKPSSACKGHREKTFKYYRVRNNSYQVRYTKNLITYSKDFKTELEAKLFIQQLGLI